jgi:putative redox protein
VSTIAPMRDAIVRTGSGKFGQLIELGPHRLAADEPVEAGGDDTAPAPHDFLLAALGACTSMTLSMYAARKGWPLESVEVRLSQHKEDGTHVIQREVRMSGPLSDEQRERLLEIANKCPVHKTLSGPIRIDSRLGP